MINIHLELKFNNIRQIFDILEKGIRKTKNAHPIVKESLI